MAILGGSPLGLIGIKSLPSNGSSGFNGGTTRNVNVQSYNNSDAGSLFSSGVKLRAWPDVNSKSVTNTESGNFTRSVLHNNDIYDTSILNLIEKLANTKASLRPSDFVYLKDVGVYPNNRLMIARRFSTAISNDIMRKGNPALSTVISWLPQEQDFLNITFGEVWDDAAADFTELINNIGADISKKSLGNIAGAGANAIPLPGFTEIFQRRFFEELGIFKNGPDQIPSGNPNLIKMAKQRKLVGYSESGSGLSCKVDIKMVCEWELKFISGIDPTVAWMDILNMVTRFGTSESADYGLSSQFENKITSWTESPSKMISDIIDAIANTLTGVKDELLSSIEGVFNKIKKIKTDPKEVAKNFVNEITEVGVDILKGIMLKYKVQLLGVTHALSGLPSTPWHITVGNPLRPVFTSGDMLTQDVSLTLGPVLAFNDLPSSIKIEFTLTNARPWGMQEIMQKFNSGYLRTVDVKKTYMETKVGESADAIKGAPVSDKDGNVSNTVASATQSTTVNSLASKVDIQPDTQKTVEVGGQKIN